MTTALFAGLYPARGKAVAIASGDYHTADPSTVNVNCKGAVSLRVAIDVTAISGAGCTATVTISGINDDASATTYTLLSKAVTTSGVTELIVDPRVGSSAGHIDQEPLPELIQIAVVGSGTKTTLAYSVEVEVGA